MPSGYTKGESGPDMEKREMTKKTREIVINRCFGGFGLSDEAHDFIKDRALAREGGFKGYSGSIPRDDPDLVAAVKELGGAVNGRFAKLGIVLIPGDIKWTVEEYDGFEWVAEAHRTWR
jgi:hypothetical protein